MSKKILAIFTIALLMIFSFSICLANTNESILGNATNDIRNFVGGVENTVENAASDVSNTSKNITGAAENTMSGNNDNTFMGMTDNDNGRYSATRTSTNDGTVMGMTSTAWTWIILGIAAIAIIAVVWYYSMQFTNSNNHIDRD